MHITERYFDETVDFIAEILRYDSSMKAAEENAPFGKEVAACLQAFLAKAESFGFETKNYDNYVGEVIFGKGEPFAILAHLDVVPAGDGWTYPPFGGVINDDESSTGVKGKKIWGRGALDDKGPAVCCLYSSFCSPASLHLRVWIPAIPCIWKALTSINCRLLLKVNFSGRCSLPNLLRLLLPQPHHTPPHPTFLSCVSFLHKNITP